VDLLFLLVPPGARRASPVTAGPDSPGRLKAIGALVRDDDPGGLGGEERAAEELGSQPAPQRGGFR